MDDQQEPTQATESDELPAKRGMMDRLRDAVHSEPSTDDVTHADRGTETEAEVAARALEDEFWGKK